jgi:CRAL/TRIO domain
MSTSPTDYVSTLTPEIVKLAKEQLEEDDERRAQNVNIIREWLKKQPHLRSCPTDSQFLLKFLRGCKYSLETTKQKLDLMLTLRNMLPGLYSSWDPMKPENQKALSFGPLLPLPGYDHLGRRVAIIRSGFPDPSATNFEVIQRVSFMVWELFCHEEEQMFITGAVLILDMEGYTISHFTQLPMSLAKKLQLCWEDASPVRLKSID